MVLIDGPPCRHKGLVPFPRSACREPCPIQRIPELLQSGNSLFIRGLLSTVAHDSHRHLDGLDSLEEISSFLSEL
jgi:hypothetical protein